MSVINASFPDELGSIFADTVAEIVSKISGFSLSPVSSEPNGDFAGAVGLMNLIGKNGENSAALFISASEADMRVLCSSMTGVPKEDVTKEDVDDALCEIVNMTAGNVKLRVGSDYAFMLSTPFVINGENMSLVTKKRVKVVSISLSSDEISMKLKVICETPASVH